MLRPVPSVCQAAGEGALGVHARETAEGPDGEDVLVARVADSAGLVEDAGDVLLQEHQCSPRLHWTGAPQTKPGEGSWRGVSVGARPSAVTHQVPDLGPSPCNPCSLAAGLARAGPGEGGQPRVHVWPQPAGTGGGGSRAPRHGRPHPSQCSLRRPLTPVAALPPHRPLWGVSKPQVPKATPAREQPTDTAAAGAVGPGRRAPGASRRWGAAS